MKLATKLMIGVGAYLAYSAWAVAEAVKQLTCSVTTVAYNKANSSLLKSELIVKINILNPTKEHVSFERFSGSVSVGNQLLASLMYATPGTLTPGDNPLQIPVSISHITFGTNIVNILKALLSGKKITDVFKVVGNVYAGGIQIPITQEIVAQAISGPGYRNVYKGLIPAYSKTQIVNGQKRFTAEPYGVGCPDCITPNSSL